MVPLRPIAFFFVRCLAIYGLLILPWPGLMDAYRSAFRSTGNLLFQRIGGAGRVSFEPISHVDHDKDTEVVVETWRRGRSSGRMSIKATYTGYRPTAFLAALVLATTIPWSRRWRALAWGLLWVNAFVAFRVWIRIVDALSEDNALNLFQLSRFWKGLLAGARDVLAFSPEASYIVPLAIWILVTFRRGDRAVVLAPAASTSVRETNEYRKRPRREP